MRICAIGRGFQLTFESHKTDKLSLFEHGARAFDHIILLPPKSKGTILVITHLSTLTSVRRTGPSIDS